MAARLSFLVTFAFFAPVCFGQTPAPTSTYTLHAQKEPHRWCLVECVADPSTVITLVPDNALLILLPQPGGKWVLKRLMDWGTQSPQETTLSFAGDGSRDKNEWIRGDLTVNPDGSYLIVRIISHYAIHNEPASKAIVILVDLRSFSIVLRRATTDPLLASSEVHFNSNDLLIAKGIVKVNRAVVGSHSSSIDTETYAAGVLTLPDLQPTPSCRYDALRELRFGSGGWNWTTPEYKDANADCAAVLEAAGASSVEDLPGGDHRLEPIAKLLNFDCQITDMSREEKLALYYCSKALLDGSIPTSRAFRVISVADRKTVVSIPLPFTQPVAALLAENSIQNYLLLLRDGIRLETYRLN
jgi:hypothetical protein